MTRLPGTTRPRVLCVDDEPAVTLALRRVLRQGFEVVAAGSAAAGLELIRQGPPFAVVISDFHMPEMDGAVFLSEVRQLVPDTVRVLLTGGNDLASAVAAINEGQIYRFVAKPVAPALLLAVVRSACEQHRLLTSERVLLEQTLHGSIGALVALLALAQPAAVGKTSRLKGHASALAERLGVAERWSLEIAALFSQAGCITLPETTMQKLSHGYLLSVPERALVARLPAIAESLIADIPRLDAVREILRYQDTQFDGTGSPRAGVREGAIPIGARILKVVLDFDLLEAQATPAAVALDVMAGRQGWYDPDVLQAFRELQEPGVEAIPVREMLLRDVQIGMAFAADLIAADGMLLAARGQEVTRGIVERVWNQWSDWATTHRVSMIVTGG